jgi:release factor glutamine methyltransferase
MKSSIKQYEVLNWASLFLKEHHCEEQIAGILLQHHLSVTRSEFYMMMQEPIPEPIINRFKADIHKHVDTGVPVQHLIGYEMFYGRKFSVNNHVLIPRPETEELVQQIIEATEKYPQEQRLTIVDIGTGSGVIAITLALEVPRARIYATDISTAALQVAQKNANQLGANINFLQGDYLQPIIDNGINIDIIVSNPPYISKLDESTLSRTVKDFDPNIALFADENGLLAYRRILELSTKMAKQPSMIFFEIGYKQGNAVKTLIHHTYPQIDVDIIKDINENDRIVTAKLS